MILAGDMGGTKTLLALFRLEQNKLVIHSERKYPSMEIGSLEETVLDFLQGELGSLPTIPIRAACFSVAGPTHADIIPLSNLPLTLNTKDIQAQLPFIPVIRFCNDLEALAHGLLVLSSQQLLCLHPGGTEDDNGQLAHSSSLNKAIIAPGTGLGEALIMEGHRVYPTEGGHGDFAPQSEEEIQLWRFLRRDFPHVSYERILSGPGLANIYRFLSGEEASPLSPADISQRALARVCPLCQKALEIFIRVLGAEAGNLALKSLALGGIYLGGGIPPKIIPALREGDFLESFWQKGRFTSLLKEIPLYVILDERTPIKGAASLAVQSLAE